MSSLFRKFSLTMVILIFAGLVLSACSGGGTGSSNTVDVNITLTEFKIESSVTSFKQGVNYRFNVVNKGAVEHEIYVMPPATGAMTPQEVISSALVGISADKLQPGQTATIDYTFTKAYPSGSLELACHVAGHYEAGMLLPITVQ